NEHPLAPIEPGPEPQLAVAIADGRRIERTRHVVARRRVALARTVTMQIGHQLIAAPIEHLVVVVARRLSGNLDASRGEHLLRDPAGTLRRDEAAIETRLHEHFEDRAWCE